MVVEHRSTSKTIQPKLNLVKVNATKVVIVLIYTTGALVTFALAENGAAKITGSDYSGYKASAVDRSHDSEKPSENKISCCWISA